MPLLNKLSISNRTILIFFFLTGLLVYLNSFSAPFHYDDFYYLKDNPAIKSFEGFRAWLAADYSRVFTGRPVLLFTFLLNYKLGGLDTFGYHFLNLMIHISNAFLLYLIFFRHAEEDREKGYSLKYILAATLFLIHPLNTESVTYISSRSSVLSAFFMLSSMFCFFRATKEKLNLRYYFAGIISFILGLSVKETTAVLPVLLMLFDYFFISKGSKNLCARIKYHIPYLLVIGFLSVLYAGYITMPMPLARRPWLTHIFTEFKVFTEYLKLLVVPVGLNIDHDIKPSHFIDMNTAFSLLAILAFISAAVLLRKKHRVISFSMFWFFINLIPFWVIRLNDFMAERWLYFASIGFSVGMAYILFMIMTAFFRTGLVIILSVVLALGTLTIFRNNIYASPVLLWQDAVQKSPGKWRPYLNLSLAYIESGDMTKAFKNIRESVKRGVSIESYMALAVAYESKGDYKAAEKVLKIVEKDAQGYFLYYRNMGSIYMKMGEYEKAISSFKRADEIKPGSSLILFSIGQCYENLSENDRAKEFFMLAVKTVPQNSEGYLWQGASFLRLGKINEAVEAFLEAVKIDPTDVNARINLAELLFGTGYNDEAFKQYAIAAEIYPNYARAYAGMGLVMFQKGNPKEARKYFTRALSLLPPDSPERKELLELLAKTQG